MGHTQHIHKAGGVLIRDKRFLVTRSKGKTVFVAPGGKCEAGETATQSLVRELREELNITVREEDLTAFGSFTAIAAGTHNTQVHMDVFIVEKWEGDIVPSSEVEEVLWINSHIPRNIQIGSIFQHDVLPNLKQRDLID